MINWVRKNVPRGDLLEFDIKQHGWAELAGFLGRQPPGPGEPFPWLNTGSSSYQITKAKLYPGTFIGFWVLMLASVIANWLGFQLLARLCGCFCSRLCGCCGSSAKKQV
eukprot:UN4820